MSGTAIRVEDLGKQYSIGRAVEPYGSVRESLSRLVTRPLHRTGNKSNTSTYSGRLKDPANNILWALKELSFEVKQGEVVGIIGRNGAGKSTLLKLLSRVTEPTTGQVELYGRIGALLEVGTGFHPELTGRENIYLNGAILGMTRADIRRHFDEIVAFAEVEKFVDTPVKRYSSGMYLRLAFAVAAHLEPEILVVDEVLAVGDFAFQAKCIGKMGDVAKTGRTVLFVSHNLQVVHSLCTRTILIDAGRITHDGATDTVLRAYNHHSQVQTNITDINLKDRLNRASGAVRFTSIVATDEEGAEKWEYSPGDTIRLRLQCEVFDAVTNLGVYLALRTGAVSEIVTSLKMVVSEQPLSPGTVMTSTVVICDGRGVLLPSKGRNREE